jgi:O-antigen/teichoic acid export membrane protein
MLQSTIRYVIIRGTISLLAIISLVVAVRLLGPEETGKMTLVVGLISMLAPMLAFGTDTALARFVVNAPSVVANNLYRRAFFLVGLGTVCLIVLAVLTVPLKILPPEVSDVAPWVVVISVIYSATLVNVYMLRGLGKLNISSVFEGIIEIGPRLLVVPLLILFLPSYVSYIHTQLISLVFCLTLSSWVIWYVRNKSVSAKKEANQNQEDRQGYWFYASQMWIANVLSLMFINVSLWILRYYLSPREVGLFSVAQRLPTILVLLFLSPLSAPLLYFYTSNTDLQKRSRDIIQAIVLLSAVVGMLCLGLAGNSAWIVERIFGVEFTGAAPAFMIYAHVPLTMAAQSVLNPLMASQNRMHILNGLTVCNVIVLVGFSMWLVPIYGLVGASMVVLAVWLAANFAYAFWIRQSVPGLVGAFAQLYLLYLPCVLLSVTPLWPVGVLAYPLILLATKTMDRYLAIDVVRHLLAAVNLSRLTEIRPD